MKKCVYFNTNISALDGSFFEWCPCGFVCWNEIRNGYSFVSSIINKISSSYKMNQIGHGQSHSLLAMEHLLEKVKQHLYGIVNDHNIDEHWKKNQIIILLRLVNLVNRVILSKEKAIHISGDHTVDKWMPQSTIKKIIMAILVRTSCSDSKYFFICKACNLASNYRML